MQFTVPPWYARADRAHLNGVPEGADALALRASCLALADIGRPVLQVCRDDTRMAQLAEALAFFAPELEVLRFPAWDCLPYDRVSPQAELVAERVEALSRLAQDRRPDQPLLILTTVAAVLQRVPARATLKPLTRAYRIGDRVDLKDLSDYFIRVGYVRSDTVREPGEFAVRGGIVDVFPPGAGEPLRLDLFGDALDQIRGFDPATQRSTAKLDEALFKPASEIALDEASIARFRSGYRALFGADVASDPIYEAVSAGRKPLGAEHWLPLFHDQLETLFDYLPGVAVALDQQADQAVAARLEQIEEFYEARRSFAQVKGETTPYLPLPPDRLYVSGDEWEAALEIRAVAAFAPGAPPPGPGFFDLGGRPGRDFADVRAQPGAPLLEAVKTHADALRKAGKIRLFAAYSNGSRERLRHMLGEHGLDAVLVDSWAEALKLPAKSVALAVLGLPRGFETAKVAVLAESDLFGDRLIRAVKKRKRANVLSDVAALNEGDLVVHVDHGVGRYDGLETLEVGGAPHDCLRLIYAGGDKLYLPVESMDALTRFGSEEAGTTLDKLGGLGWQQRKAKVKQRVREIADKLIQVAAQRYLRKGELMTPAEGLYDEFCARFPYAETDDQLRAIDDAVADLQSGKPMDRLICGDVGFGKTEVAMRVAFVAAMSGAQVAVVAPTTLLARQHARNFTERFSGLPLRVEPLSRLVSAKRAKEIKEGLADGSVDIVVGTHAVLAKAISFKRLGLLIVDEEQHFGVAQKERMKELKADVHVLTLTATPIPRTLQMALTGVRDMSVIATPPVDRLAVRTFVLPYDPVVIREAIMREHFRGGQSFYVCPRIEDLDEVAARVRKLVPEIKIAVAHGRLAAAQLEEVMNAFCDRQYDMLISTNIVESGLDISTANTMILHRADMFGLAQLYQLRGRIGRSKIRGYAYLTLPANRTPTTAAMKRLEVMQTLDQLGAGFQLASHDLDIRGAGNLLGGEQSGHIKEVGVELYQHLLEEAVAAARAGAEKGEKSAGPADEWTPQISIGSPVLIPESYVEDLGLRLSLYRRVADLADREEIDGFAAEMIDRFGPLPAEVDNLLRIIEIKQLCRAAGVEKVDAGPKGAVFGFRNNQFRNPSGLVSYLSKQAGTVKLRPDHKLVCIRGWELPAQRVTGVRDMAETLAKIVAQQTDKHAAAKAATGLAPAAPAPASAAKSGPVKAGPVKAGPVKAGGTKKLGR